MLWAATSLLAPIAILIALYYRIAGVERSISDQGKANGGMKRVRDQRIEAAVGDPREHPQRA
ncbi:MAG: hypothetical protein WAK69_20970 [Rhodoplanes sp.]